MHRVSSQDIQYILELKLIRDPKQITSVTLNGFCPLSKKSPTPLFLTDIVKLGGIPTKTKWKKHALFTLYFKVTSGDMIFHQKFLELHSKLSEKRFSSNIFIF